MKKGLKSLYRSPVKTAVTLLLLAAAAFLFLYNLGEYNVSDREYKEARDKYEGVLTVDGEHIPDNPTEYDYFLVTDETSNANTYGHTYEENHQTSMTEDLIEKLSSLSHISRVEKRYLTAGVSLNNIRMDMNQQFFPYNARAVLVATVREQYPTISSGDLQLKQYHP